MTYTEMVENAISHKIVEESPNGYQVISSFLGGRAFVYALAYRGLVLLWDTNAAVVYKEYDRS